MVQSPWREDAKWENTGLCAGEAETDTGQRKSGMMGVRKPTTSQALWSHIRLNGTPGASWWAAWGRKDDTPSGEDPPCDPQASGHIKLHSNDLEMKDSL